MNEGASVDREYYHRGQSTPKGPKRIPDRQLSLSVAGDRTLPDQRRKAARFVAASATDAIDCAELLDMLGLDASEGKG